MTAPIFVDTNVLVYAVDVGAGERHTTAREWMQALWEHESGRLSVQVLQEFYVTVTRKLRPCMSHAEAQREVRALLPWGPILRTNTVVASQRFDRWFSNLAGPGEVWSYREDDDGIGGIDVFRLRMN